jgi:hypothetical protein
MRPHPATTAAGRIPTTVEHRAVALLVGLLVFALFAAGARLLRLADWIILRRNRVLGVTAIVAVVFGFAASRLRTNDPFVQYFSESTQFRKDADFTMRNLSGIYRLEFQLPSGGPDSITEPTYLAKLDAFDGWLRAQPEVDHAFSLSDIVKDVHRAAHADAPTPYRLPDTRASAAELLLLYEMALPPRLDLKDRVSADRASTRVSVIVKDMSSRDMTASRCARASCMMIVLRNVRLGILSVVPNVVPILVS